MADFPVSSIESQLLEKIITKLQWKSYFRLQQTCKQMEEMVRTNKNIKGIHVDMDIHYYDDMDFYRLKNSNDIDDSNYIFGVCWEKFTIEMVEDEDFDFLEFFENNRITCRQLDFEKRSDIEWELEKFERMFEVLKPKVFRRGDYDDDFDPSFDILFEAERLEEVQMYVELESTRNFYEIVTRLVSHFCKVDLYVFPADLTQQKVCNLLSTMLQYIYSQPLPQFTTLEIHLSLRNDPGLSSTDYLHDLLRKYKVAEEAVPNLKGRSVLHSIPMSALCLSSMEHHLLEKIIIKLEWKSYFRLQQTCKQMDEMIWTNKNIKGIRADMHISYYNNMDYYSLRNSHNPDDCTYIYGVCWEKITIEMVEDDDFDFLEFFKSHRITCRQLDFEKRTEIEHPLEEFVRMFKVLKPKAFRRGDYDTDFYPSFDVLFEAEGLKEVEIHVELVNAPKFYEIVTRLVSHFCRVVLYVFPTDWTQENVSNLLSTMLQYIHSHPLPQFKSLELHLSGTNGSGLSCTDYLHGLLRKYKINEEAVPNLNETDYEITIGDYNYQEHYFCESSIAVLDLRAISMACQIDCRRMYFLGIVMGGLTNRITIQRM